MSRLRRILPLLLVLAPAGMLWTVWEDPLSAGEDDVVYFHPVRKMVGEALREGRWPLENPLEATGTALMGDPQTAVMYPPTWLFAALDDRLAYSLSIVLAFSVAALGTWLYLRRLGLVPSAAALGATAFAYSGFFVGHRVHLGMIHTAALLPWGLWCIEGVRAARGASRAGSGRRALGWAVPVFYLAVTSGHWPTLLHASLIWGVYLLARGRPFGRALVALGGGAALALLLAAPQLAASWDLLGQATRQRLGYAIAGENSFFPPAAVLFLFPFLMGSRTPNLFPQDWWGPGHHGEVLGYVGLATIVLAAAGAASLASRRARRALRSEGSSHPAEVAGLWTWMGVGAAIFMLGYWLPTYRLIHAVPFLGVVRCPARMVLAVEMALAVLAALALHVAAGGDGGEPVGRIRERLRRRVRRGVTFLLPGLMLAVPLLLAAVAAALPSAWRERMPWPMEGGVRDVLEAVRPANPAVWVPLGLCLLTAAATRWWLRRPGSRAPVLGALVLLDLLVLTRFVDVPPSPEVARDPGRSPAAAWIAARRAADPRPFLVWGLGRTYHDRPRELLLPKTAHALGVGTLNAYGPFQPPAHAHLFEFRHWGTSRAWERLVRRNALLSLYGVRYLLAADPAVRATLEDVRAPAEPAAPDGPSLLGGSWRLSGGAEAGEVLRLQAPWLLPPSRAEQEVGLAPEQTYRIRLEARGPRGGAAHWLRAGLRDPRLAAAHTPEEDPWALVVPADQIGAGWRRFEWVLTTPARLSERSTFAVDTMSERPVEVRRIELVPSGPDRPVVRAGRLAPSAAVYRRVAELRPEGAEDLPVAIYENLLWEPAGRRPMKRASADQVERLKWDPRPWVEDPEAPLADVGFAPSPRVGGLLLGVSLPALVAWLLACAVRRGPRRARGGTTGP